MAFASLRKVVIEFCVIAVVSCKEADLEMCSQQRDAPRNGAAMLQRGQAISGAHNPRQDTASHANHGAQARERVPKDLLHRLMAMEQEMLRNSSGDVQRRVEASALGPIATTQSNRSTHMVPGANAELQAKLDSLRNKLQPEDANWQAAIKKILEKLAAKAEEKKRAEQAAKDRAEKNSKIQSELATGSKIVPQSNKEEQRNLSTAATAPVAAVGAISTTPEIPQPPMARAATVAEPPVANSQVSQEEMRKAEQDAKNRTEQDAKIQTQATEKESDIQAKGEAEHETDGSAAQAIRRNRTSLPQADQIELVKSAIHEAVSQAAAVSGHAPQEMLYRNMHLNNVTIHVNIPQPVHAQEDEFEEELAVRKTQLKTLQAQRQERAGDVAELKKQIEAEKLKSVEEAMRRMNAEAKLEEQKRRVGEEEERRKKTETMLEETEKQMRTKAQEEAKNTVHEEARKADTEAKTKAEVPPRNQSLEEMPQSEVTKKSSAKAEMQQQVAIRNAAIKNNAASEDAPAKSQKVADEKQEDLEDKEIKVLEEQIKQLEASLGHTEATRPPSSHTVERQLSLMSEQGAAPQVSKQEAYRQALKLLIEVPGSDLEKDLETALKKAQEILVVAQQAREAAALVSQLAIAEQATQQSQKTPARSPTPAENEARMKAENEMLQALSRSALAEKNRVQAEQDARQVIENQAKLRNEWVMQIKATHQPQTNQVSPAAAASTESEARLKAENEFLQAQFQAKAAETARVKAEQDAHHVMKAEQVQASERARDATNANIKTADHAPQGTMREEEFRIQNQQLQAEAAEKAKIKAAKHVSQAVMSENEFRIQNEQLQAQLIAAMHKQKQAPQTIPVPQEQALPAVAQEAQAGEQAPLSSCTVDCNGKRCGYCDNTGCCTVDISGGTCKALKPDAVITCQSKGEKTEEEFKAQNEQLQAQLIAGMHKQEQAPQAIPVPQEQALPAVAQEAQASEQAPLSSCTVDCNGKRCGYCDNTGCCTVDISGGTCKALKPDAVITCQSKGEKTEEEFKLQNEQLQADLSAAWAKAKAVENDELLGRASEAEKTTAVEEEPRLEAEVEAKQEAGTEAKTKVEGEAKAKAESEANAKVEAEAKANGEAEANAKVEVLEKAKFKAEENGKNEAQQRAKAEAEHNATVDVEQTATSDAEEDAKVEAEAKAKGEAEAKVTLEAEQKAKVEAEQTAKVEAEQTTKVEAEQTATANAEAEKKSDVKEEARLEAEVATKQEAEAETMANVNGEAQAKAEANATAKVKAEAKAKGEAGANAKAEVLETAKLDAGENAKNEAEQKAKAEAEQKAKVDAEQKTKSEAEENAKVEADAKAKGEAEAKAKFEAEQKAKVEAEQTVKAEAEQKADRAHTSMTETVHAEEKKATAEATTLYLPTTKNGQPLLEHAGPGLWKVVFAKGVAYRKTKNLGDRVTGGRGPEHGEVIQGVDEEDGWIRVSMEESKGVVDVRADIQNDEEAHEKAIKKAADKVEKAKKKDDEGKLQESKKTKATNTRPSEQVSIIKIDEGEHPSALEKAAKETEEYYNNVTDMAMQAALSPLSIPQDITPAKHVVMFPKRKEEVSSNETKHARSWLKASWDALWGEHKVTDRNLLDVTSVGQSAALSQTGYEAVIASRSPREIAKYLHWVMAAEGYRPKEGDIERVKAALTTADGDFLRLQTEIGRL